MTSTVETTLKVLTSASIPELTEALTARIRGQELLIIEFGPEVTARRIAAGTLELTPERAGSSIVLAIQGQVVGGKDNDFWLPFMAGGPYRLYDAGYLDVWTLGAMHRFVATRPVPDLQASHVLTADRFHPMAMAIRAKARDHDIVVIHSRPGHADTVTTFTAASFKVTDDNEGVHLTGEAISPAEGSPRLTFGSDWHFGLRPGYSLDFNGAGGTDSLRFLPPIE